MRSSSCPDSLYILFMLPLRYSITFIDIQRVNLSKNAILLNVLFESDVVIDSMLCWPYLLSILVNQVN